MLYTLSSLLINSILCFFNGFSTTSTSVISDSDELSTTIGSEFFLIDNGLGGDLINL